ncbi:unnamed protein product [Prorocentrum cordatum]|uniref:RNase H type-1 domain-containing protein n=1 Tax=Prorocentrum cordatum TaxID=2364126 RepID=A0ABN9UQH1_9DINO|nr:unnamed protein product [Polarella glacialis]
MALMLTGGSDFDPMFRCSSEVVFTLHRACWEGWLPMHVLQDCFAAEAERVRTWSQARGPLGAAILALRRLGWSVDSLGQWATPDGLRYAPLDYDPRTTKRVVCESVARWQSSHVLEGQGLDPGVLPIRQLRRWTEHGRGSAAEARKWPPLTREGRGYVRSVPVDGQRPQERRRDAGLADHPFCARCSRPDICALVSRLLMAMPQGTWRPSCGDVLHNVRCVIGDGSFFDSGEVFTDGSAFDAKSHGTAVAGGAVVELSPGAPWAADGPRSARRAIAAGLQGPVQGIDGGELLAILLAVLRAVPPLVIWTDSSFVAKGLYERGEAATRAAASAWAHLWRRVWIAVHDFGGLGPLGATVRKLPAHAPARAVEGGKLSWRCRRGNWEVDRVAKAFVAELRAPQEELERWARHRQLLDGAIFWVAGAGGAAARSRLDIEPGGKRAAIPRNTALAITKHHAAQLADGAFFCLRCCRSCSAEQVGGFWRPPCTARPGERARAQLEAFSGRASSGAAEWALGVVAAVDESDPAFLAISAGEVATEDELGHAILASHGYCMCIRCGSYSRDRKGRCRALGKPCPRRFGGRDESG